MMDEFLTPSPVKKRKRNDAASFSTPSGQKIRVGKNLKPKDAPTYSKDFNNESPPKFALKNPSTSRSFIQENAEAGPSSQDRRPASTGTQTSTRTTSRVPRPTSKKVALRKKDVDSDVDSDRTPPPSILTPSTAKKRKLAEFKNSKGSISALLVRMVTESFRQTEKASPKVDIDVVELTSSSEEDAKLKPPKRCRIFVSTALTEVIDLCSEEETTKKAPRPQEAHTEIIVLSSEDESEVPPLPKIPPSKFLTKKLHPLISPLSRAQAGESTTQRANESPTAESTVLQRSPSLQRQPSIHIEHEGREPQYQVDEPLYIPPSSLTPPHTSVASHEISDLQDIPTPSDSIEAQRPVLTQGILQALLEESIKTPSNISTASYTSVFIFPSSSGDRSLPQISYAEVVPRPALHTHRFFGQALTSNASVINSKPQIQTRHPTIQVAQPSLPCSDAAVESKPVHQYSGRAMASSIPQSKSASIADDQEMTYEPSPFKISDELEPPSHLVQLSSVMGSSSAQSGSTSFPECIPENVTAGTRTEAPSLTLITFPLSEPSEARPTHIALDVPGSLRPVDSFVGHSGIAPIEEAQEGLKDDVLACRRLEQELPNPKLPIKVISMPTSILDHVQFAPLAEASTEGGPPLKKAPGSGGDIGSVVSEKEAIENLWDHTIDFIESSEIDRGFSQPRSTSIRQVERSTDPLPLLPVHHAAEARQSSTINSHGSGPSISEKLPCELEIEPEVLSTSSEHETGSNDLYSLAHQQPAIRSILDTDSKTSSTDISLKNIDSMPNNPITELNVTSISPPGLEPHYEAIDYMWGLDLSELSMHVLLQAGSRKHYDDVDLPGLELLYPDEIL